MDARDTTHSTVLGVARITGRDNAARPASRNQALPSTRGALYRFTAFLRARGGSKRVQVDFQIAAARTADSSNWPRPVSPSPPSKIGRSHRRT